MRSPILAPVMTLVLWTLVMWAWLYATRIPAMRKHRVSLNPTRSREDMQAKLPPRVRWKADNYNHLLEQPTIFYAVCLTLALLGVGGGVNAALAWAYVALRVAHSLVQATVNKIIVRFAIFTASTLALLALAVRAAILVF